jgi:hypothetical protein
MHAGAVTVLSEWFCMAEQGYDGLAQKAPMRLRPRMPASNQHAAAVRPRIVIILQVFCNMGLVFELGLCRGAAFGADVLVM